MTKTSKPHLSPAEQDLLDHVTVRLIRPEERAAFDELLIKEHYLKNADLAGEQLRYVAEHQGQWVALLTWNAAAFNLRERERWIGWAPPSEEAATELGGQQQPLCHSDPRAQPGQPRHETVRRASLLGLVADL
jgi:hypothetical protein